MNEKEVINKIYESIKLSDLTNEQLCKNIGIHPSSLWRYMTLKISMPLDVLINILKELNLNISIS